MILRALFLLFTLGSISSLWAQKPVISHDWEANRGLFELSDEESNYPDYVVESHRRYLYRWEGDNLVTYLTDHKITRVKTTAAIERHNRIYISMRNVQDIIELKARSINKHGKVTIFDKNNLKEVKDNKSDNTYRIFAIEGIESESEVEYFYTLKLNPRMQESYYFQRDTPMRLFTFELVSPKSLVFDLRLYNDSGIIASDTFDMQNRYSFTKRNIPGTRNEEYTFVDAYSKRIEIKLTYNFSSTNARLNTWADAARVFYRTLAKADKETERTLDAFIKRLKDNPKADPVVRIKNIEDKVKSLVRVNRSSSDPALNDVMAILKSLQASEEGITKVMFRVYERLGIPIYIVLTCDREYGKFDGTFDTWAFLDEYLFYFPHTGGLLDPDEFELRYPLIPRTLSGHQGLFIEPVSVDNLKTGIAWIRDIPALPYTADTNDLEIEVQLDGELEHAQVIQNQTFVGYDAASLIPYYSIMSKEDQSKFVDELFRASIPDLLIDKWSVSMSEKAHMPVIRFSVNYRTKSFLEVAGTRLLFKFGELIGPQSELYSEQSRQFPVENTNNRGYTRVIKFTIPKGYTVNNLNALNSNVEYRDGDSVPFSFTSSYTVNGDVITVKIEEYYKQLYAPIERFEDFRKVINAAADFNKVTLVLIKK
ncbi:MAG: DUF3857 domain-containing protein [Cyclobacteriaceae bacterium]|nr:DUF3857 domain-containing protein [Cyclobacteriaceae bacterium]